MAGAHEPVNEEKLRGLLAAIVESSDDAIISHTLDGTITSWNRGAERLFGYGAAEAVGQNISLIIPAERQEEAEHILAQVREGERVEHFEAARIGKGGRHIEINITTSPVRDSAGRIIGASNIAQDITERREIEKLRGLLAAIVESSDDAIISHTLDGTITSWNSSAERLFGYGAAEAVGQNISLIIPAERQEEADHILAKVREGERVEHFETARIGKDGRHIEINITTSPVRDSAGQIIGASNIAQDITERREAEAKLSFYMQELERSHQALSDYTQTVSHDLRAPLRHIMQYCELLKEETGDRLGTEGTEHVNGLFVSTRRLQRLVDDLLSYAQVIHAKEEKQELDLNETVGEVIESLESVIEENDATIHAGSLPAMPVYPLRIRQLFQNLIVNAMKYRSTRDPLIKIECTDKKKHYLFSVRDNGMGIPEESQETIFKAFRRLHTQEETEGSGLGLSICAKAVEMHEGRIWVESKLGEGSVFFFTIPKS